jgi:hypothetical protein
MFQMQGETFCVFDRRITPAKDGGFTINTFGSPKPFKPTTDIEEWVITTLGELNGQAEEGQLVVWINPHAARALFASGTLKPEHTKTAVAGTVIDLTDRESCYVCSEVTFAFGDQQQQLPVVISPRDPYRQVSLVRLQALEPNRVNFEQAKRWNMPKAV